MSWDFCTTTEQVARRDYHCQASDWIFELDLKGQLSFSELRSIAKAKRDKWKIKKGDRYTKTKGKFYGEFAVFRARLDLDKICINHDLYGDY